MLEDVDVHVHAMMPDDDEAIVIAAEVTPASSGILAGEPITTAVLREIATGRDHRVRIVGGPTKNGGYAYLAGYVIPSVGMHVRLDLTTPPSASAQAAALRALFFSSGLSSSSTSGATQWIPNTPPGAWDASALPLSFVLALPRSRDLGADALGELDVAARAWGRPACTSFRARASDKEQPSITPADDGINAVFFHDDAWPAELVAGALGQTVVHIDSNGKLHDADIHLNGVDFRFSTSGVAGTQDVRSVLTHEIGHALGLGHSNDPRATMNASGSGLRWRSLEKDDIDGVCSLYPGTAGIGGGAGCDTTPCPTGFLCVANVCQRPGERTDVCAPCTQEIAFACEAAGDDARCVDIGSGATAGRVCGRACAKDSDCGAGFACKPTTEAGDLQCISLTQCKNGANTCSIDADCKDSTAACRAGICVGPAPSTTSDAGSSDAGTHADAGAETEGPIARGGDCDCRATSVSAGAMPQAGSVSGSRLRRSPSPFPQSALVAMAIALAFFVTRRLASRRRAGRRPR